MSKYKTVKEIAEMFNVTPPSVRFWIKNGLKHKTEKVIGIKPRVVIDPKDVEDYLKIGVR